MELKKIKMVKYFTKVLLELGSWGFSEYEVTRCANITAVVDKLIVLHKELHNCREGSTVYI